MSGSVPNHDDVGGAMRLRQAQNMSGSVLLTTEASQLSVGIAGETALCRKF